jgi:hypothetical protein
VRSLAPGKIRAMQRTGKKFFIYPGASRNQIYVGEQSFLLREDEVIQ